LFLTLNEIQQIDGGIQPLGLINHYAKYQILERKKKICRCQIKTLIENKLMIIEKDNK